jgi:hypothetical protein
MLCPLDQTGKSVEKLVALFLSTSLRTARVQSV